MWKREYWERRRALFDFSWFFFWFLSFFLFIID
jgi:hypothetical protein